MADVIVLNASYEELHRVDVRHAIRMLWRGVAEIEEADPDRSFGPYPLPLVVRLVRYVKTGWKWTKRSVRGGRVTETRVKDTWTPHTRAGSPVFSFEGVKARDHGQCAYCGQPNGTTVDHVVPRYQGGPSTWENCVAACEEHNWAKANRTPEQAGMRLLWEGFVPTFDDLAKH